MMGSYTLRTILEDRVIGEALRAGELWEPFVALALRQLSWDFPRATLLDVGANIGVHTLPAARWFKKVVAVEPLFADLLRENLARNGIENVEVIEAAIGDKAGSARMAVDQHNPGASYLSDEGHPVKMLTLADVMPEGEVVLKIDIEGAEYMALAGADLSNVVAMIVEVSEAQLNRVSGATTDDLMAVLGEEVRFVQGGRFTPVPIAEAYCNVIVRAA